MNLLIDITYPYDFVKKIVMVYKRDIKLGLKLEDFSKIDVEMNSFFQFPDVILSKEVIQYALDNMVIIKRSQHWCVQFNEVINYPKTRIKMITLLQFISYGNSSVHGNTLLTDEFKKLNKDLDKLYKIYRIKGVVV